MIVDSRCWKHNEDGSYTLHPTVTGEGVPEVCDCDALDRCVILYHMTLATVVQQPGGLWLSDILTGLCRTGLHEGPNQAKAYVNVQLYADRDGRRRTVRFVTRHGVGGVSLSTDAVFIGAVDVGTFEDTPTVSYLGDPRSGGKDGVHYTPHGGIPYA